jgi:taurine--2-oxoglutarate transaminase
MTGDPRRWGSEPGIAGVIHVMDPYPYSFGWGATEEEITKKNLGYLREVIQYEGNRFSFLVEIFWNFLNSSAGPSNIAGFILETVVGTNGVLKAPKGYLEGVRALCDEYGIVMIADEVMAGFGRTGNSICIRSSVDLPILSPTIQPTSIFLTDHTTN